MKGLRIFCGVITAAVLLGVGLPAAEQTDSKGSRYDNIPKRNAFGLKPPEPPPPPEAPPPPTTTVKLTGITSLLSSKRALLQISEQGKQVSKVMQEGDREGVVEVVAIDVDAGTVKIINGDREVLLDMEKDGVKPTPAAPSAPARPGAPGNPAGGPQPPNALPPVPPSVTIPNMAPSGHPSAGMPTDPNNPMAVNAVPGMQRPMRQPSGSGVLVYPGAGGAPPMTIPDPAQRPPPPQ